MKKLMICCENGKEDYYKEKAKDIYFGMAEVVNSLPDNPDCVFAVCPETASMHSVLEEASQQGKRIYYVTEQFVPMGIFESLLKES